MNIYGRLFWFIVFVSGGPLARLWVVWGKLRTCGWPQTPTATSASCSAYTRRARMLLSGIKQKRFRLDTRNARIMIVFAK